AAENVRVIANDLARVERSLAREVDVRVISAVDDDHVSIFTTRMRAEPTDRFEYRVGKPLHLRALQPLGERATEDSFEGDRGDLAVVGDDPDVGRVGSRGGDGDHVLEAAIDLSERPLRPFRPAAMRHLV